MLKTSVSCFEDQHLRGGDGGWGWKKTLTHLTGPVLEKPYLQNNGVCDSRCQTAPLGKLSRDQRSGNEGFYLVAAPPPSSHTCPEHSDRRSTDVR